MLKVGDTVKVISDTVSHWDPEKRTEYIPIGTICTVANIENEDGGTPYYGITPLGRDYTFCYYENELEKGHMEWIKDEWGKFMNNFDISNLEYALDKIRQVKNGVLKKPMDRIKYMQLCNCEDSILKAMDVINMMNRGDFDTYYNE